MSDIADSGLPTPYYDDGQITIYHGDCREILPLIELGSIDLVLTDPPYGIRLEEHGRTGIDYSIIGDTDQSIGIHALEAFSTLPVIAFASPQKPWPGTWRQFLVWDKGPAVGGGGDLETCWKFSWELIQIARTAKLNGQRDGSVLRFWVNPQNSKDHPAAKPVSLLRYLIDKTTTARALILDPFMGSGTTLRAAKDLGRRAIGIEIEKRYCEIAAKRLRQSVLPLEIEAVS